MDNDLPIWVSAVTALLSLAMASTALRKSNSTTQLDRTIRLALSSFKEELNRDKLLINAEAMDYRFKGEDDKIRSLEHRTQRNSNHIAMILSYLLKTGMDPREVITGDLSDGPSR